MSQVREEVQNSFSVEDLLDAKAGLTTGSEHAEVWGSSAFFAKAKEVFSRDPIYTLNLRELVGHTAEYVVCPFHSLSLSLHSLYEVKRPEDCR